MFISWDCLKVTKPFSNVSLILAAKCAYQGKQSIHKEKQKVIAAWVHLLCKVSCKLTLLLHFLNQDVMQLPYRKILR